MPVSFGWTLATASTVENLSSLQQTGAATGRDIALDVDDELLLVDGDLSLVSGLDAVAQGLKIRLRFFRGEWFRNPGIGIPFFDEVLVKNPNTVAVRSILRSEILEEPGVDSVTSLELDYDNETRTVTPRFVAKSDLGELVLSVPVEI